jgi:deoxycytidine triphosphate deaminase
MIAMYLSDRDMRWAIERGSLIVKAPDDSLAPKIDPSSIDLRLDKLDEAKVWDIAAYTAHVGVSGEDEPILHVGSLKYQYGSLSRFLIPPPPRKAGDPDQKVYRNGDCIFIKTDGFLLWQTKELIGTPRDDPRFICFIDGKSTRARAGLVVHLTAPTIHAGWSGNVTLEIANLGPFTFGLREDDVIAQVTVATISSTPQRSHLEAGTSTLGQTTVAGSDAP